MSSDLKQEPNKEEEIDQSSAQHEINNLQGLNGIIGQDIVQGDANKNYETSKPTATDDAALQDANKPEPQQVQENDVRNP